MMLTTRKTIIFVTILSFFLSCKEYSSTPDETKIVNDVIKKVIDDGGLIKKKGGIVRLNSILRPLSEEEVDEFSDLELYTDFIITKDKDRLLLDIDRIKKVGFYKIVLDEEDYSNVAVIHFSRVYFNPDNNKGILMSTIFCGEYCYERKVITIKKNETTGNWEIIYTNVMEIA